MTLTPPSTLPVWATTDQIDPVSGQNNVLTPPVAQQTFGWPRAEFPPRNWFNWLGRYTYEWLAYLKQQDPQSQTVVTSAVDGGASAIGICNPAIHPRGITMIYINDTASGNNSNVAIFMYTRNNTSSNVPNAISAGNFTLGTVDKTTGIIASVSSTAATPGPYNIVAVSFNSVLF